MRAPPSSASLLGPGGGSPMADAAQWVESVLLGEGGAILAVIAVAVVGLLFLTGRLAWSEAARVVLGCAIVFGAPAIVAGLMSSAERTITSPSPPVAQRSYSPPRGEMSQAEATSGASLRRD